jgi:purine-nucleoside phosphorylase
MSARSHHGGGSSTVRSVSAPTPHLEAAPGQIAPRVLLPGDPKRAQVIAKKFLDNAELHNQVRGMLGFTGTWKGVPVSVQGTGMGVPSMSIYATELFRFYGVTHAVRVGSCGALVERVKVRDLVIATAAHTNSATNTVRFGAAVHFAPVADTDMLITMRQLARERGASAHCGTVMTSDLFYDDDFAMFEKLASYGTLAVEMECSGLYTVAAAHGVKAICVATVSDHLITHEALSADDRQTGFMEMAELALDTIIAVD